MQRKTLRQIIDETVLAYLEENGGSRNKTAKDLGISLKTLYRYLQRLGVK